MDSNIILECLYYLSKKMNKDIDKLASIKFLFFADRYHLRKYGRLISEDTYYALPHGPVASNSLNILNDIMNGNNAGADKVYINRKTANSFIAVDNNYELDYLSSSDIEALDFSIENFAHYDTWTLRDLTHEYPEWKRYKNTLEGNLSKREKIQMNDFFEDADIKNDPYSIIDNEIVELSKDLYFNR